MKCFGRNDDFGELGYGDLLNRGDDSAEMGSYLPFVNLGADSPISVHTGQGFTCVKLETWDVKCWGRNNLGQLGYGDAQNRGDEPSEMSDYLPSINLGTGILIQDISVGNHQTMLQADSNQVKSWGHNGLGQVYVESEKKFFFLFFC